MLWAIIIFVFAIVWVISIVDIIRRHYPMRIASAWILLVLILPIIGSLIYWQLRQPTAEEVENRQRAEADQRHGRAHH